VAEISKKAKMPQFVKNSNRSKKNL